MLSGFCLQHFQADYQFSGSIEPFLISSVLLLANSWAPSGKTVFDVSNQPLGF